MDHEGDDRVPIGRVQRAHGVRGEIAVQAYGETLESLETGEPVWLGSERATIEHVRPGARGALLVRLREVGDRDAAEALRALEFSVPRARLPRLEEGEYYGHDLIGLTVRTEAGELVGELASILEHAAHDVYRVVGADGETLLPATREVIRGIDLESRTMIVRPLPDA